MTPDQISSLFSILERIVFLLQALFVSTCFLCGFVSMKFIIHAKNQKNLF